MLSSAWFVAFLALWYIKALMPSTQINPTSLAEAFRITNQAVLVSYCVSKVLF